MSQTQILDVAIAGAGFGGAYALKTFRDQGYKVKAFEKGASLGGIWYWNCYPGARVDSDYTVYQFSDPELWKGWTWSERFPGWEELRRYYKYVDSKWDLSKDIQFNTTVTGAQFDERTNLWVITLSTGENVKARWFVPAMGFAAKKYVPTFKGIDSFKRVAVHTAEWPQTGLDLKDKRVAVIGTGASGVQVIQDVADQVKHMTVFQRTPNLALPMHQTKLNKHSEDLRKADGTYERIINNRRKMHTGYEFTDLDEVAQNVSPEKRREVFESLWGAGGLRFQLSTFKDLFTDQRTNDEAYAFWAEKTRSRIVDPRKKDLLAPLKQIHPFGTKRPSLEQNFYEKFNQHNVDLKDLNETPIIEFTETGIRTKEGVEEFDVVILATGFDNMTGSFTQLDIRGTDGRDIKTHWKEGVHTYLGLAVNKFPNMFVIYGPQAPSSSSNGPTIIELQTEVIAKMIDYAESNKFSRVEPQQEAEDDWKTAINEAWARTLFPKAKSWYQGANIPGKKVEALNWAAGLPSYIDIVDNVEMDGYRGFNFSSLDAPAQSNPYNDDRVMARLS